MRELDISKWLLVAACAFSFFVGGIVAKLTDFNKSIVVVDKPDTTPPKSPVEFLGDWKVGDCFQSTLFRESWEEPHRIHKLTQEGVEKWRHISYNVSEKKWYIAAMDDVFKFQLSGEGLFGKHYKHVSCPTEG